MAVLANGGGREQELLFTTEALRHGEKAVADRNRVQKRVSKLLVSQLLSPCVFFAVSVSLLRVSVPPW
jgi:hypothetical protein